MFNKKDNLIREAIPNPGVIPVGKTAQEVKENQFRRVKKLMSQGYSVTASIRKVTGRKPLKNVDREIKESKQKKTKMALASVLSLSLIGGGIWGITQKYSSGSIDALTGVSSEEVKTQPLQGDKMILVAGKDERSKTALSNEGTSDDVSGVRTDVLSLVSVPKDGSRAIAVSIPRDTIINKPECQLYDYNTQRYLDAESPEENGVKINSVYQEGGPKCLVKSIEDTVGVKINGYAEIGFDSFASVVDSLGGIDIKEKAPLYDDTLGQITDHAGTVHMDGKKALDYVRARKIEGTGKSDFDRINRQQKFMSSLISELKNKATGSNSDKINFVKDIATDVLPKTKTDGIGTEEAISLVSSLLNMDSSSIRMTTIPITDDSVNTNDLMIDKVKSKDLFNKLVNNIPLEGDKPKAHSSDTFTAKEVSLDKKHIVIASKSRYDERAQKLKNRLSSSGAMVSIVESQKIPQKSMIYVNGRNKDTVATLASLYPKSTVTPYLADKSLGDSGDAAIITIGSDFTQAFATVNSFKEGKTVYIPKNKETRAGIIVPQKIPGSSGKRDINSLR